MRSLALLACACLLARVFGGDAAPTEKPPTEKPPATATKSTALNFLTDEEKWVFQPAVGRSDVFYDYEQWLLVDRQVKGDGGPRSPTPDVAPENPRERAKQAIMRIEGFMSQRKWEDAIKVADIEIKQLQVSDDPEIVKYIATIKGYRDQAQDALTRDEAQAAFDALGLKVVGIMWSETGTRLALIAGEPRALGINDRVKDCVIINIDTDRVDFRYHFKRKRFEFPRYVGEDAKSK
ncbi:MAG: hypothetical protein H0W83_03760 [Planctomycetes bacterium]|nr:hypothetical protein [Planctomycetota bacterium]